MSSNNKLTTAIVIVHLICNLLIGLYLIALQIDAQNQRAISSKQRVELKKQNDYIICVLQVNPDNRTENVVSACRSKTIDAN